MVSAMVSAGLESDMSAMVSAERYGERWS